MKSNLKRKIMLVVLAGGMLYANGAFAYSNDWYGYGDNATTWKGDAIDDHTGACKTGANLTLNGSGSHGGIDFADADRFIAGYVYSGNVTNNTLTVNGGTFKYNAALFGGFVDNDGDVTGNQVNITNGNFENGNIQIWGGFTRNGIASNNIVTISGGSFGNDFWLNGGEAPGGTSSNNTLNLKIKVSGKASQVYYFQKMNFTLPSDIANGDTMLKTQYVIYDNTIINVDAANGVKLNSGDVITLIAADGTWSTTIGNDGAYVLDGTGQISMSGTNLILTMLQDYSSGGGGNTDQQKAPVEAIAAGVAMINQSADLAMGEGMASLLANTDQPQVQKVDLNNLNQNQNENTDTKTNAETDTDNKNKQEVENNKKYAPFVNTDTFGAITASRSKYQTGSHVDMDGWGVLVGVGQTQGHKHGDKTTYGLFFEYGKGDFDTYNNDIHGEGDSNNKGVGVIARQTLKNNTYIEGNIRYGKQETEWSETDTGSYDTDSRYIGVAVGLGHVYPLENNDELDVYVRYSYGHTGASDAKVKDSDYHFDGVTSKRVRFGAKYNFERIKKAKPYLGLAWEHEMDGECRAVITGVGEAPAPSLKGNTGIMEFGIDWETGDWILGLGGEAYVGKRKGWSGMARAFYNF